MLAHSRVVIRSIPGRLTLSSGLLAAAILIAAQPDAHSCALRGVVTEGSPPVPSANVNLLLKCGPHSELTAESTTGPSGAFEFLSLPPAPCSLEISKPGLLLDPFSASRAASVLLRPGDSPPLAFHLLRGAVITGSLLFPSSPEPLRVVALRRENWLDPPQYRIAASTTSDERGRYRLFGLPPGAYSIAAVSFTGASADLRLPPVFSRTPVSVAAGETASRVDVVLPPAPPAHSISGVVRDAVPPSGLAVVSLYASGYPLPLASAIASSTGEFQFPALPEGDYQVVASAPVAGISSPLLFRGAPRSARTALTVTSATSAPLTLDLLPAVSVEVQVAPGDAGPACAQALSVQLEPAAGSPFHSPTARPATSGAIKLTAFPGLLYRLFVRTPPGCFVESILTPSGEPIPDPFPAASAGGLRIALTSRTGSIAGLVDGPAGRCAVAVAAAREPFQLLRTVACDESGAFLSGPLGPGAYRLLAAPAVSAALLSDPSFWLHSRPLVVDALVAAGASTQTSLSLGKLTP